MVNVCNRTERREKKEQINKRRPSFKRRFHSNNTTEQDGRLTLEKRNPNVSFVGDRMLLCDTEGTISFQGKHEICTVTVELLLASKIEYYI